MAYCLHRIVITVSMQFCHILESDFYFRNCLVIGRSYKSEMSLLCGAGNTSDTAFECLKERKSPLIPLMVVNIAWEFPQHQENALTKLSSSL